MIKVSKTEAAEIRERFPQVAVYKTMKQANHHNYFVEETRAVLAYLDKTRKEKVTEHYE